MDKVSYAMAFTAGLLSFLSPCILPLIPAYLSYIAGNAITDITREEAKIRLTFKALGFVLGFSAIFILLGASASSLGQMLNEYKDTLSKIGGIFIIIIGIHLTGLVKIKFLYQEKRLLALSDKNRGLGSFVMGMAFAAGWTPCIGPILSSILIYAANMDTISSGIILLSFYSLGLAIPFLITAFAIGKFALFFKGFTKYLNSVSILSGVLIIITGILILTNKLTLLVSI